MAITAESTIAELVATIGLKIKHKEFEEGDKVIDKLKEGLELFSGGLKAFVGFEVAHKFFEMTQHTMEAAVEADHLSKRLGISSDAVQTLGYAAASSGSSVGELQGGMQRLARGLQDAKDKGTGPVVSGFEQMHLSMDKVKNLNLDETLMEIAEQFKEMPDGLKKSAIASELFGRSAGPGLIPFLNKGKEGIVELREEYISLGGVISGESIEKLKKYEDTQTKIKATMGALRDQITIGLLPALQAFADGLATVGHFLASHPVIIEALEASIVALGLVITYFAAAAAVAWIVALGPIGLITAAITAAIAAVVFLWLHFSKGKMTISDLGRAMVAFGKSVKDFFVGIGEGIAAPFIAIYKKIVEAVHVVQKWWEGKTFNGKTALDTAQEGVRHPGASNIGNNVTGLSDAQAMITQQRYLIPHAPIDALPPITINGLDVHVESNSKNPEEHGRIVGEHVEKHLERVWRQTQAETE